MPKLDGTHLPERLAERLADLKADKEVAARDVKALLNDEQIAAMDAAWKEQQALRKVKRARTKEEEQELGWKTKREIYIDAYEKAFNQASDGVLEEFERLYVFAGQGTHDTRIPLAAVYDDILSEFKHAGKHCVAS